MEILILILKKGKLKKQLRRLDFARAGTAHKAFTEQTSCLTCREKKLPKAKVKYQG